MKQGKHRRPISSEDFTNPSEPPALSAADIFARNKFDPLHELVKSAKRTEGLMIKARARLESVELEDLLGGDGSDIVGLMRLVRDLEANYDSLCRELAQYAHPKRKAVEMTGAAGGPVAMSVQVSFVAAGEPA